MTTECPRCGTYLSLIADMCWFCGRMFDDATELYERWAQRQEPTWPT